jgi:FixJ family two-component response regulator
MTVSEDKPVVSVVDDDPSVREAMDGLKVEAPVSIQLFRIEPECIEHSTVDDFRMPSRFP